MASLLDQLFGQIESGNNPWQGFQPVGTIGGQYQQSYGFQQQFGGNNTGSTILDPAYQESTLGNFVSQVLGANPNISVADAYAEYNLGSGNPGSGPTVADLSPTVLNNLTRSAAGLGVDPGAPLASLTNGTAVTAVTAGGGTTAKAPASGNAQASSCGSALNPLNWPCHVFSFPIVQRIGYGIVGVMLIMMALVIYALRTRDQS